MHAVAAPYAHVTAPLRRLCDRAANEVVPGPAGGRRGARVGGGRGRGAARGDGRGDRPRVAPYARAALDLVEALVLRPAVGRRFPAVVVDVDDERAQVQLRDPAVVARARAARACAPGDEVEVVVRGADPAARRIDLEVA